MPLNHASDACGCQNGKQPKAELYTDALCNKSGHQWHENDGHWQAVPDQAVVVRCQVIVGRAKRCEHEADKHNEVRPALACINEPRQARLSGKKSQSPQSSDKKRHIGGNITEVWD